MMNLKIAQAEVMAISSYLSYHNTDKHDDDYKDNSTHELNLLSLLFGFL